MGAGGWRQASIAASGQPGLHMTALQVRPTMQSVLLQQSLPGLEQFAGQSLDVFGSTVRLPVAPSAADVVLHDRSQPVGQASQAVETLLQGLEISHFPLSRSSWHGDSGRRRRSGSLFQAGHGRQKGIPQAWISTSRVTLRGCDLGMSEKLADALNRHALVGQTAGESVTQLMATQADTSSATILLEAILNARNRQGTVMLVQKEMIALHLRSLRQPDAQHCVPVRSNPHDAFLTAFAAYPQPCTLRRHCRRFQVRTVQGHHFAYPQPCANHQAEHRPIPHLLHDCEQTINLSVQRISGHGLSLLNTMPSPVHRIWPGLIWFQAGQKLEEGVQRCHPSIDGCRTQPTLRLVGYKAVNILRSYLLRLFWPYQPQKHLKIAHIVLGRAAITISATQILGESLEILIHPYLGSFLAVSCPQCTAL